VWSSQHFAQAAACFDLLARTLEKNTVEECLPMSLVGNERINFM